MPTAIHHKVHAANLGENPQVICRMKSGWAVMGDYQYYPGYSLLLPDPVVPHLNALEGKERVQFLQDMALLGDAVLHVTGATRINYEMLGNLEPALHAHVIPRRADEPEEFRTKPIWLAPFDKPEWKFCLERDAGLMEQIMEAVDRIAHEWMQ